MAAADVMLFDAYDRPMTFERRPPEPISPIGRSRDNWAGSSTGMVTPEVLVSVMRGDADLTRKMSVYKRMLLDSQIFAAMRILANTISRLKITVQPLDDSAEAKKDAEDGQRMVDGLRWMKDLIKYLIFGEFYPFTAAEWLWNTKTWVPDGFVRINAERWAWNRATNEPRLRTKRQPMGEELPPWGFITHKASLQPGTLLESGFGNVLAWPWLFTATSWEYQMRFAALFGNPHIWAFYDGEDNKDSVFEAIKALTANARAAFPKGTEVKMAEAQRYGTIAVYKEIREASDGAKVKVILGHILNLDAPGDTGALSGGYANAVSQENKEGVAGGMGETLQMGLMVPWWGFTRGWDRVISNEIPIITIECKPPVDLQQKATTFVSVNQVLASAGRAIDPEQIEDDFNVRTVEIQQAKPEPQDDPKKKTEDDAKAKALVAAAAAKKSKGVDTLDDVEEAGTVIVAASAAEFSAIATRIFEEAETIEAGLSQLWLEHGFVDSSLAVSAMRDVTMAAHLMSEAETAAEHSGGDE